MEWCRGCANQATGQDLFQKLLDDRLGAPADEKTPVDPGILDTEAQVFEKRDLRVGERLKTLYREGAKSAKKSLHSLF